MDAIIRTVERRKSIAPKTAILIGEPDPPSYQSMQKSIGEELHGHEWTTYYVPPGVAKVGATIADFVQGGDAFIKPFMVDMADDHYALDISRARELLGWEPKHNLAGMLPTIAGLLKSDPDDWYRKNGLK